MTAAANASVPQLVALLSDPEQAKSVVGFPADAAAANHAGLYSWWAASGEARELLSEPFDLLLPELIYAGQAGATSTRSRTERAATLHTRIGGNHLNGNIGSSTFRKTLAAVLLHPLDLRLAAPDRLDRASNSKLSAWMRQNLRLAIAPYPDRATLATVEHAVLAALDPPLNLMGMPHTPVRRQLSKLRAALSGPTAPTNP